MEKKDYFGGNVKMTTERITDKEKKSEGEWIIIVLVSLHVHKLMMIMTLLVS